MKVKNLAFVVAASLGVSATPAILAADLNEGLVAHYQFEGNAQDSSGNDHHGMGHNGVKYEAGKFGQAAKFDGNNDFITAVLPVVKKTYSVSLWAKFKNNTSEENQLFYLTRNGKKDRLGYLSTYPPGERKWHFGSRRYDKGWEDRGTSVKDPEGLLDNVWYHLVFILNNNQISLYVNGKLVKIINSAHSSDIEAHGNLKLMFGGTTEGYQHMYGRIDEARFYNRVLSECEIQMLYQPKPDVMIGDTPHGYGGSPDMGGEPDYYMASQPMWRSRNIWVRNRQGNPGGHQNPKNGRENEVYVQVQNRGGEAASNIKVKVYWAHAATGLAWPKHWTEIDEVTLDNLDACASKEVTMSWFPPAPRGHDGHFCMFAVATADQDPITFPDISRPGSFVRYNNNVAWRNVNIIGAPPKNPTSNVDFVARNINDDLAIVRLELQTTDCNGEPVAIPPGTILELGVLSPDKIKQVKGGTLQVDETTGEVSVLITGETASIDLEMEVDEELDLRMNFDAAQGRGCHLLSVIQSTVEGDDIQEDGGIQYHFFIDETLDVTLNGSLQATSVPQSNDVRLEWSTGSENETAGFSIWRGTPTDGKCSKDLNKYTTKKSVGFVNNQGSKAEGQSYSYIDKEVPSNQTVCYVLVEHNFNGDINEIFWDDMVKWPK